MTPELVDDLKQFIDQRLMSIDLRLDAHDKRFDAIDRRLDSHVKRFDDLELKLDKVIDTFGAVHVEHEVRLTKFES